MSLLIYHFAAVYQAVIRLDIMHKSSVFNSNAFILPHIMHAKGFACAFGQPQFVNIYSDRTLFTAEIKDSERYIAVFKKTRIRFDIVGPDRVQLEYLAAGFVLIYFYKLFICEYFEGFFVHIAYIAAYHKRRTEQCPY